MGLTRIPRYRKSRKLAAKQLRVEAVNADTSAAGRLTARDSHLSKNATMI
jgi:hypothetical protein